MKKITFLITFFLCLSLTAQTGSGDTTFVNTNQVDLDYFGNFDSSVDFPDGSESYRKIFMTLELGQYDCPPGTQYCHQWDYTVHIELITDTETYELGRFITPFATSGWPRFGSSWKQPYVFDVTDFYPLLQGQNDIRIRYKGYSGGFTAEIEFAFVEGTPERNVVGIENAYQISQTYGDSNDPFNDYLTTFSDTAPAGTEEASMKVLVDGHGSDDNGCCEFASHFYKVMLDNSQIAQEDIWRDDCGENDIYPQGGTWIYDRANWCPGNIVAPMYHSLPNVLDGTSFDVDVEFEDYNGSGNLGKYNYNAVVFYYGEPNHNVDVAITDIITPSNAPQHYRENPSGSVPKIEVRNTGSTAINSIDFNYGVQDSTQTSYTWNGNLPALENKTIALPELETLTNTSIAEVNGVQQFNVEITGVNGQTDNDQSNDSRQSNFVAAPFWPSTITVKMKTSNLGANGYFNQGPADVSWEITDMDGTIIDSRTNADVATQYEDDVELPETGFYKLKLTSTNCFGLNWWVLNQSYPIYESGSLKVLKPSGGNLQMNNYTYTGTPRDDWGCSYTQYFSIEKDPAAGVEDFAVSSFKVYPNPAREIVNIAINGEFNPPYKLKLVDLQGRVIYQATGKKKHLQIPVNQFSEGLYILTFENSKNETQSQRVIIGQ